MLWKENGGVTMMLTKRLLNSLVVAAVIGFAGTAWAQKTAQDAREQEVVQDYLEKINDQFDEIGPLCICGKVKGADIPELHGAVGELWKTGVDEARGLIRAECRVYLFTKELEAKVKKAGGKVDFHKAVCD
jgi:hypothetical protein